MQQNIPETINVLIVDDSGLTREVLSRILEMDPAIRVIGMAENGKQAIELTQKLKPDVITMDIQMPVLDGFAAVEQIMAYYPTPILILSSVLDKGGIYSTFNALAIGAVDVMEKPSAVPNTLWSKMGDTLIKKVKTVSKAKVITHVKGKIKEFPKPQRNVVSFRKPKRHEVVGIGASTGGPSVLMEILKHVPPDYSTAILVVQHMAEGFTRSFVEWLKTACKVNITLAEEGVRIEKGQVFIAPDGFHTIVTKKKTIGLVSGKPVNNVKPSVDMLFNSLAEIYGESTVGILLTGMGVDGAEGLKRIKESGGIAIAQSEESCTIFGMPKAAIEQGAVSKILSVKDIIHTLLSGYDTNEL